MYGHIHVILKDLVLSVAGLATWKKILVEAGFDDAEKKVLDAVPMGDDVTFALVGATCKVLNLTLDKALHVYGHHFVQYVLRSGNRAFLKSQGATFPEFLDNVNNLHNYLERAHPIAKFPFLVTEFDAATNSVHLSYLSTRQGLKSLLVGVIEEIGLRLYGVDVMFEEMAKVPEELTHAAANNRAASWKVTWTDRPGGPEPLPDLPPLPKVPFPVLHGAMTELVGMMRRAPAALRQRRGAGPCRCGSSARVDDDERPKDLRGTTREKWDKVKLLSRRDSDLEMVLLRTVPAAKVGASWSDESLPRVSAFWSSQVGRAEDYALSKDDVQIDVFVSHAWGAPSNWEEVMGSETSYADMKSTMVNIMAKDIAMANGDIGDWGEVRMWVDKACIVQDIAELKDMCISLIDRFIRHSEHVCVVFTWSYLERLWCVYEWAAILVEKDPRKLWMQNENLVTERTLPLYLDSVRNFSLARTKCAVESDRAILREKIDLSYISEEAFETMVKATAIALMARSMAFRAGRSHVMRDRFFMPWVMLAEELGLRDLADALGTCRSLQWRAGDTEAVRRFSKSKTEQPPQVLQSQSTADYSMIDRKSSAPSSDHGVTSPFNNTRSQRSEDVRAVDTVTGVSATRYHKLINSWFDEHVVPVLAEIRKVTEVINI